MEKHRMDFWELWLLQSLAELLSFSRLSVPFLRRRTLEKTNPKDLPVLMFSALYTFSSV